MSDSNGGIVYVLSNPAMPGLVKIGKTTRDQVDDRLKELFNTSVPVPFECDYACKVQNCDKVEKALHIAFSPNRIHPQREFFSIAAHQAIAILSVLEIENVTPDVQKEITAELKHEDAESSKKLKQQRRPQLNYTEMGIPIGSQLVFIDSEKYSTVKVLSDRLIEYNGEEMSLTQATKLILGIDYSLQPTRFWSFEGKNLSEIYNDTYSTVDDN